MKSFGWIIFLALIGLVAAIFFSHNSPPEPPKENPEEISNGNPNPQIASSKPTGGSPANAVNQNSVPDSSEPSHAIRSGENTTENDRKTVEVLPPLKDVLLKDEQGKPAILDQKDAIKSCAAHGMRLPTIRELARLAQSRGAKGILEPSALRDQDEIEGYKQVYALTGNGKTDKFYYNPTGYVDATYSHIGENQMVGLRAADGGNPVELDYAPKGAVDLPRIGSRLQYWSSSETVGHSNEVDPDLHSFYVLDIYGKIHDHYHSVASLARCIANP